MLRNKFIAKLMLGVPGKRTAALVADGDKQSAARCLYRASDCQTGGSIITKVVIAEINRVHKGH